MSKGKRSPYRAAVADYLRSAAGADTSQEAASRLAKLDPWALGMNDPPMHEQLHATRMFLEELGAGHGAR